MSASTTADGGLLALMGDEAAALGAIHAGISAAYGYPGTPSTEIMEYLMGAGEGLRASWCANEKTALEAGLGVSFAGRRALVTMKHVGLNVAADPFINGALLGIGGGLVIAVADDPGMHSSQNEQDSRFYASFAMVPCLEPRSQQEAYDMAREAFEVSERFGTPVLFRLVTRLSHARGGVRTGPALPQKVLSKAEDRTRWMLLPAYARENYAKLLEKQRDIAAWSAGHGANLLELEGREKDLVIISSGLGGNYYEENLEDLVKSRGGKIPARLHIGAYPLPEEKIRLLCEGAGEALVLEEGQPFIEERLRGILPRDGLSPDGPTRPFRVSGRLDGRVARTGELDPDKARLALGLGPRPGLLDLLPDGAAERIRGLGRAARPPQLCQGCPHADSYEAIKRAAAELDPAPGHPSVSINSDIGCYSLGAAPPLSVPESIVCMGASVGMARGAAGAGIPYAVAVIGDSTFLHSGITALIDAVQEDSPMTLVILDNSTVAMTGCQDTMIPSANLGKLILGLGVKAGHFLELEARRQLIEGNAAKLKAEMEYRGLSVVIFRRECLEAYRKRKKKS